MASGAGARRGTSARRCQYKKICYIDDDIAIISVFLIYIYHIYFLTIYCFCCYSFMKC